MIHHSAVLFEGDYLNINNIDIVVICISCEPWNSITCYFGTPGNTANYCVMMISSEIVSSCNKQV